MKRLVLLALTGCSTAYTAEVPVQLDAVASMVQAPVVTTPGLVMAQPIDTDRMEANPAYNSEVLEAAALHVVMLSEADRKPLTDAMSSLLANCPFARSRVMVALTLERELMAMDPSSMSTIGQQRFAELLREVQAAASFLRATRADSLPTPLPSDFLATAVRTVDGLTFAASDDPVGLSFAAIEQVDAAVRIMPTATQEEIQAAWAVIDPHMGDDIALRFAEQHARETLSTLLKTEAVDVLPAGLIHVSALMEEMMSHGC